MESGGLSELEEMPNISPANSELQARIAEIDALSKEWWDLDFPKQEKTEEQVP